jgi:hypothetical protein
VWRWFSGSCGGATCVVGTGDAGVGPDACRIEMYLYTLYLGMDIVRAKMMRAVVGVRVMRMSCQRYGKLLQVIVPILPIAGRA